MTFQFGDGAFTAPGVGISRTIRTTIPNDVNNAAWSKGAVTITTGRTDPFGGTSAEAMFETTANAYHDISQAWASSSLVTTAHYLQEAIAKPIGGRVIQLRTFSNGFGSGCYGWFDPATMTTNFTSYGNMVVERVEIAPFGGGYGRCRLFFRVTANETCDGSFFNSQTSLTNDPAFVGDATKGVDFHHAAAYSVP